MGSGLDWKDIVDKLSPDFHCIAVDLPGHGKTNVHGAITDYSMEAFARSFPKFVRNIGLTKPALIGYSMGGRLALFLSAYVKNLWSALILESATPGLMQEKQRVERRAKDGKLIRKLEKGNLENFLEDWYQQPLFKTIKKSKSFNALMNQRLNNDTEELIKSLKMMGLGVQPSLWNACASINMPVLLLAGEFDRKFSNIIKDMKKLNQDFDLAFVKNAGHNVHVEQALEYIQYLKKFLNNVRENHK